MNVIDLEQDDQARIKIERDLLAEAIWQMGTDIKLINPSIVISAPSLLQICSDIVEIYNFNNVTIVCDATNNVK